jgi:hypothetical protein
MLKIITALFYIYIINNFNKNIIKINVKITSGCDERYDYQNETDIKHMDEFKYNFSKKLLFLHLINTLNNPTISIYFKALLIDNYNIFDDFSHNMITNKDSIHGSDIIAGGLFNQWDFDM